MSVRAVRGAGARGGSSGDLEPRGRGGPIARNESARGAADRPFAPVRGPAGFGAVPVARYGRAARPRASDPGPRPRRIVPGAPRGSSVYTTTSVRGSVALRRADPRSRLERGPPSRANKYSVRMCDLCTRTVYSRICHTNQLKKNLMPERGLSEY